MGHFIGLLRPALDEIYSLCRPALAGRVLSRGETMATRLSHWLRHLAMSLALGGTALLTGCDLIGEDTATPASSCPQGFGWAEGLPRYFNADAQLPTAFGADADDCL